MERSGIQGRLLDPCIPDIQALFPGEEVTYREGVPATLETILSLTLRFFWKSESRVSNPNVYTKSWADPIKETSLMYRK